MKFWTQTLGITLISAFFFSFFTVTVLAASEKPYRIFILHSYEHNHVCGQPQHDGVISALKSAGFKEGTDFEIRAYYMDTKRKNNTPDLIHAQAGKALEEISLFRPQVLVTLDDNAFREVALKLVDTPVFIVFSGLNGQPEAYDKMIPCILSRLNPGHNVTGVYEKLHISDAIRVHATLLPLEKVKIFVDTSPTGSAIARQIELELGGEAVSCSWEMKTIGGWEEYQAEIFSTNKDPLVGAIYPAVLMLKDRKGKTYTAPEIFAWTTENSKKPEIPLNYAFARMGLFGGAAVDFRAMGVQVGKMVSRIFKGEKAGSIPLEDARKFALVFNLKRASQLGITIPSDILMAADDLIVE